MNKKLNYFFTIMITIPHPTKKRKLFVKQIIRVIIKRCHPLPKKKNVAFVSKPLEQKIIALHLVVIPFVSYV